MQKQLDKEKKINEFFKSNTKSHFLQSAQWAKVKNNWRHEMIVVEENEIKGTMSVLLRKVPIFNRYIMYAPRGFVCNIYDKETLKKLTEEAKNIAKKYKAFIFRLDPDIPETDEKFKQIIKELGYKTKKSINNIDQVIQPKYVYRLDLKNKTEEDLLMSFESKTRYNVRLAIKRGVKIKEGTKKDLETFYKILVETGIRDNFFVRSITYFEKIYDCLSPEHVKILNAEYNGEVIASTMAIIYGDKIWYLYGGSLNKYRNLMPNYLLQFEMMKIGLENECSTYDFRGVSGYKDKTDPQYGVYRFKKGFNGELVEFINELYIIFNPVMNFIFNIGERLYKQLETVKNKIKIK